MLSSLSGRFLFASAILLPVFLGLTGFFLERAFSNSLYEAEIEKLKVQIYLLLGAAEIDQNALYLPDVLQEPKYAQLNSGLYGVVLNHEMEPQWVSPSAQLLELDKLMVLNESWEPGEGSFGDIRLKQSSTGEHALFYYTYPVLWEVSNGVEVPLKFVVFSSKRAFLAVLAQYQAYLWVWLSAVAIFLLISQGIIMRWGLKPLKRLAADLGDIEDGKASHLKGHYPKEVENVTQNLNQLLDSERQQRERYYNTLGDLAHSLKTPLAVMRAAVPGEHSDYSALVSEQVERMDQIVGHQLQRAQSRSHHGLLKPITLLPIVERLTRALNKVYRDARIQVDISETSFCRVDEADLLELLGNVMDNACKCSNGTVRVSCESLSESGKRFQIIRVEDNGPGIPEAERRFILERGARADTVNTGQGIGLAVVVDIISSYQGGIDVQDSDLGGALFALSLPME